MALFSAFGKYPTYGHNYRLEAVQVTAANITPVTNWCWGSIKGIRLPPEEQVIDISAAYSDNNEEQRARVGDWIVQVSMAPDIFRVVPPDRFALIYRQLFEGIG
jgi:hypothetical protein